MLLWLCVFVIWDWSLGSSVLRSWQTTLLGKRHLLRRFWIFIYLHALLGFPSILCPNWLCVCFMELQKCNICKNMPSCLRLHISDFTNFHRFYGMVLLGDLPARRWVVLQSEQVWWVFSHSKRTRSNQNDQIWSRHVKTMSTQGTFCCAIHVGFSWHCSQLKVTSKIGLWRELKARRGRVRLRKTRDCAKN